MGRLEVANFPCKDCADRHVGCHGKCEGYISSKKRLAEFDRVVNKRKDFENYTKPLIEPARPKSKWEKFERKQKQK